MSDSIIESLINNIKEFLNKNILEFKCDEYILRLKDISYPETIMIIKDFYVKEEKNIAIDYICLDVKYQKLGIYTRFLNILSQMFDAIYVFDCNAINSCILLTTKLEDRYFTNTKMFFHYWKRQDVRYNHQKSEMIACLIVPFRNSMKISISNFYKEIYKNLEIYREYIV